MKKSPFHSDINRKLSELVTAHPSLLLTLSHFEIGLGVGDKSVKKVCEQHGIDPYFFLLVCRVYTFSDFIPDKDVLMATDMSALVPYLRRSHAYYLDKRIPHIGHHLEKIEAMLPAKAATAIKHFYADYTAEVQSHFGHEEAVVFPHIDALLKGEQAKQVLTRDFVSKHGNLEELLEDLIQIIFKYLPSVGTDDDAIDMIFDILVLKQDLHNHSLIEERILVPYIQGLEKRVKA